MYSKSAQYGIKAVLYIAKNQVEGKLIGLLEIAKKEKIPSHFLSKILQILVKAKILKSIKGPNGGFWLPSEGMTLLKVVNAIDKPDKHLACLCGHCSEKRPCSIRKYYHDELIIPSWFDKLLNEKVSKMVEG